MAHKGAPRVPRQLPAGFLAVPADSLEEGPDRIFDGVCVGPIRGTAGQRTEQA